MRRGDYEINIIPADNGFSLNIGCKRLVFQGEAQIKDGLKDLEKYLTNGLKVQRELHQKYCSEDECDALHEPVLTFRG